MMKRLLSLLLILVFAMSAAFALDGIVTWVWYVNDWDVQYYRYQLDGEDDDKWTVVGWDVNEVTLELDVSVVHTLYLQQSYDGVTWSVSSSADSEIYEAGTTEEVKPEEEMSEVIEVTPDEIHEKEEEVVEEEAVEEVVDEGPKYESFTYLDLGVGYMNAIPNSAGPKTVGAFASYSKTLFKAGVFDIGVKANLSLYTSKNLFLDIKNTQMFTYLNALALATVVVGNCDLYGAIGPDMGLRFINDAQFNLGLAVELGVRYHRYKNFSLGFSLSDHYYLIPYTSIANRFDVRVYASKSF